MAAAGYSARGGFASSIETGTKLFISNLDYGVSNDDIKVKISFLWQFVRNPWSLLFVVFA